MTAGDLHLLAGVYALDALDATECDEFERHLATCPRCRSEVDQFRGVAALLAEAVAEPPPAGLRAKVLEAVAEGDQVPPGHTRPGTPAAGTRRTRVLLALAAAAAVVVLVSVAAVLARRADPIDSAASQLLKDPKASVISLTGPSGENGRVVWSADHQSAVVVADRMPPAKADEVYELWFIDGGQPRPGPTVAGGSPGLEHQFVVSSPPPEKIAVTIEPAPGSAQPTGPIILSGDTPR